VGELLRSDKDRRRDADEFAEFFACALLIACLPLKTSEATPREPRPATLSRCAR
jgi:hypothetical protein